ncbi:MBL fold metallo-hydrolase, partial [Klebsiella pneumoniae]|uniref:MBL fold metallo-hydrolase n=2 Tax=Pseudomonadota TaxID=1224 RepID=UPI0013D11860
SEMFRRAGEPIDRETSINSYLIDTGDRRILIEAGAGRLFGDCCGRLPATLRAAGYGPEVIDAVLLTHVHG